MLTGYDFCKTFNIIFILLVLFYRKRTEKESSRICTKVLTPEHTAVNTQINKYYVQNQYFHRPSNIPGRRGLPCEVRIGSTQIMHAMILEQMLYILSSEESPD